MINKSFFFIASALALLCFSGKTNAQMISSLGWYDVLNGHIVNSFGRYNDAAVDANGNTYVVGTVTGLVEIFNQNLSGQGGQIAFAAKYAPSGRLEWVQSYTNVTGSQVAVSDDGSLVYIAVENGSGINYRRLDPADGSTLAQNTAFFQAISAPYFKLGEMVLVPGSNDLLTAGYVFHVSSFEADLDGTAPGAQRPANLPLNTGEAYAIVTRYTSALSYVNAVLPRPSQGNIATDLAVDAGGNYFVGYVTRGNGTITYNQSYIARGVVSAMNINFDGAAMPTAGIGVPRAFLELDDTVVPNRVYSAVTIVGDNSIPGISLRRLDAPNMGVERQTAIAPSGNGINLTAFCISGDRMYLGANITSNVNIGQQGSYSGNGSPEGVFMDYQKDFQNWMAPVINYGINLGSSPTDINLIVANPANDAVVVLGRYTTTLDVDFGPGVFMENAIAPGNLGFIGHYKQNCASTLAINSLQDQFLCEPGGAFSKSITATGGTGGYAYRWRSDQTSWLSGPNNPGNLSTLNYSKFSNTSDLIDSIQVIVYDACANRISNVAVNQIIQQPSYTPGAGMPSVLTVCEGNDLVLNPNVSGGNLNFQWSKNLAILPNEDGSSLVLQDVTAADAGTYIVEVSNICGALTPIQTELTVSAPIQIAQQPAGASVCEGNSLTLSVVTPNPGVTYQWRKDGVAIPGATGPSYTIASANANAAGDYDVVITADCGSLTSSIAEVNVLSSGGNDITDGLVFHVPLDGSMAEVANNISNNFTVAFPGVADRFGNPQGAANFASAIGGVQYQSQGFLPVGSAAYSISLWFYGMLDQQYTFVGWGINSNNQSNRIETREGRQLNNYWYANDLVTPNNSYAVNQWQLVTATWDGSTQRIYVNGAQVASRVPSTPQNVANTPMILGSLSSSGAVPCYLDDVRVYNRALSPGEITALFEASEETVSVEINGNGCAALGGSVALTADVSGNGPFTYQWFKNGNALSNGGNVSGAQTAQLTLASVATNDLGNYTVEVIAGNAECGTAVLSEPVTLTIYELAIASQPQDQELCEGDALSLSVSLNNANVSYQWYRNNQAISGATSNVYSVASASLANEGNYYVEISFAGCGNAAVNSDFAEVNLVEPVGILAGINNVAACTGSEVAFEPQFTGENITVDWMLNGTLLPGSPNGTLVLSNVQPSQSGTVFMTVYNGCSNASQSAVLTVVDGVTITAQPQHQQVCEGSDAVFTVGTTGAADSFSWTFNGNPILGVTGNSLVVENPSVSESGTYQVTIQSACGTLTSQGAFLEVLGLVEVAPLPATLTACEGETLSLFAEVSGFDPLVEWFANGTAIGSGNLLELPNASVANAGEYFAQVSNACNTVNSTTMTVTLASAPSIVSQPIGGIYCAGEEVSIEAQFTGTPTTVQWYFGDPVNGVLYQNGVNPLFFESIETTDSGSFTLYVANQCGAEVSEPFNVTVHPSEVTVFNPSLCFGESFTFDGQDYTETGSYNVVYTNQFGCDSTVVINLSIADEVVVELTANGPVLDAGDGFESYQWFIDGNIIDGATNSTYTAESNGEYSVEVSTAAGCTGSASIILTTIGMDEAAASVVRFYPNPTRDIVRIDGFKGASMDVLDVRGRVLASYPGYQRTLDFSLYSAGIYYVRLLNTNGTMETIQISVLP